MTTHNFIPRPSVLRENLDFPKPVTNPGQTHDLPMTIRDFFMGPMPFGFVEISRLFWLSIY